MYEMFDLMMRSPWFYVVLVGAGVVCVLVPLLGIRLMAHREDKQTVRDQAGTHPTDQSAAPAASALHQPAPNPAAEPQHVAGTQETIAPTD
jgi:hypothetical protein